MSKFFQFLLIVSVSSLVLVAGGDTSNEESLPEWAKVPEFAKAPEYSVEPEYVKKPSYTYVPQYLELFNYLIQPDYVKKPSYTNSPNYLMGYNYLLIPEYLEAGEVLGQIYVDSGNPDVGSVSKYSALGIQISILESRGMGKYPYLTSKRYREDLTSLYQQVKESQDRAERFKERRKPVRR